MRGRTNTNVNRNTIHNCKVLGVSADLLRFDIEHTIFVQHCSVVDWVRLNRMLRLFGICLITSSRPPRHPVPIANCSFSELQYHCPCDWWYSYCEGNFKVFGCVRLEICQKIYTTGLSAKNFTQVRKLRWFLLKKKQFKCIIISYFSRIFVRI